MHSAEPSGRWCGVPRSLGDVSRHDPATTIMTEGAKTEKHTAGAPCGAYIEMACKFQLAGHYTG